LELKKLQIYNLLYESSSGKMLEFIRKDGHDCNSLMVVGHNPDVTDLANAFMKFPIEDIPTSGVVTLIFSCDHWDKINRDCLVSHQFNFPSEEE
jgi:phosphohistidine phosphatase